MKFEEFYSDIDNTYVELAEFENYIRNDENLLYYYKDHMYCPECHEPHLTYVSASNIKPSYLKTKNREQHNPNCSAAFETANDRIVRMYFKNLNTQQVNSKLDSILRILDEKAYRRDRKQEQKKDSPNPLLIDVNRAKMQVNYLLPRKVLSGWIEPKELGGKLYLYYGKVKLEVEHRNGYNNLRMFTRNNESEWKYRATLFRKHIVDDIDEKAIYNIAFVATLDKTCTKYLKFFILDDIVKYKVSAQ